MSKELDWLRQNWFKLDAVTPLTDLTDALIKVARAADGELEGEDTSLLAKVAHLRRVIREEMER